MQAALTHQHTHRHLRSVVDFARSTQWRNKSNNIIASVSTLSTQPALGAGSPGLPCPALPTGNAVSQYQRRACFAPVRRRSARTCYNTRLPLFHCQLKFTARNLCRATGVNLLLFLLSVACWPPRRARQADCPFRPQSLPQTEIEEQHLRQQPKHFAANSILLLVVAWGYGRLRKYRLQMEHRENRLTRKYGRVATSED